MRITNFLLISTLSLVSSLPSLANVHGRRRPIPHRTSSRRSSKPSHQLAIDSARATQIQTALIKSGYLQGAASGHWDSGTTSAMQRFQTDNGWQTKLMPDSRAIIKLGLGPENHVVSLAQAPTTL